MRRGDRRGGAQVMAAVLKERYDTAVKDELRKQFNYGNVMQIPKVEKIILNIGMGEAIGNAKAMDAAAGDLAAITVQRPIVTKSRKAISNFRLRIGMPIGLKVTLRGERMWHFLEKLITVALPRIRDFQGVPEKSFDGRGNFSLGLKEQLVFPEIEYDKIDRLRGMEITIVTTARSHPRPTAHRASPSRRRRSRVRRPSACRTMRSPICSRGSGTRRARATRR